MEGGEAEAGRRERARLLEPGLSSETAGTEDRKETAAPPGFRSNDENRSHHTAYHSQPKLQQMFNIVAFINRFRLFITGTFYG